MNVPGTSKICFVCGEDCTGKPRTRDRSGHYFCDPCYARAVAARKKRLAAESGDATPMAATTHNGHVIANGSLQRPQAPVDQRETSAESRSPAPSTAPPPLPQSMAAPAPAMPAPEVDIAASVPASPARIMPPSIFVPAPPTPTKREVIDPPVPPPPPSPKTSSPTSIQPDPRATDEVVQAKTSPVEPPPPSRRIEPSMFELEPEVAATFDDDASDDSADLSSHVAEAAITEASPTPDIARPRPSDPIATSAPLDPPNLPTESLIATDEIVDIANAETGETLAIAADAAVAEEIEPESVNDSSPSPRLMLLADGAPAAAFAGCPHCHRPMPTGAIVCLGCGYNIMTGQVTEEDVQRPMVRHRMPRSGWPGPIIVGGLLTMLAAAASRVLYGTDLGFMVFAAAAMVAVPLWFLWAVLDARDTDGARLRIWIVPGYILAYVFRDSRSRYLRAVTIGILAIITSFAVLGYDWNQRLRERDNAMHRMPETRADE